VYPDSEFSGEIAALLQAAMQQVGWSNFLDLESQDWFPSPEKFLTIVSSVKDPPSSQDDSAP
jgi:hypothetical protein